MIIPESSRQQMTHKYWFAAGIIALAVAFQLQATLIFYDTFVRIVLADLIAPVALAAAAIAFFRGRIGVPASRLPGLWKWLAVLSAWMFVSLLVGREYTGDWQLWAVVNKFAGWFVLMGFLVLGLLAGSVNDGRYLRLFLHALFASGWAIAAYGVAIYIFDRTWVEPLLPNADCDFRNIYYSPEARAAFPDLWIILTRLSPECSGRLQGFMANPNAYGYLVAIILTLQAPFMKRGALFPKHLHTLGFAFGLTALIFTGSRTSWFSLGIGIVVMSFLKQLRYRQLAMAALLSGAIVVATVALLTIDASPTGTAAGDRPAAPFTYFASPMIKELGTASITQRLEQTTRALELWQANPLLGVGLGGFLWEQVRASEPTPSTIHNTGLWLLTETGLIGLVLFLSFFAACLWSLWSSWRRDRDAAGACFLALMLVFAGASLGMEAMYQRHFWFLLGLGLALRRPNSDNRAPTADSTADPAGRP